MNAVSAPAAAEAKAKAEAEAEAVAEAEAEAAAAAAAEVEAAAVAMVAAATLPPCWTTNLRIRARKRAVVARCARLLGRQEATTKRKGKVSRRSSMILRNGEGVACCLLSRDPEQGTHQIQTAASQVG